MKKSELVFSFLLVPLDFLMVLLAGISAYYIRYSDFTQSFRPVVFDLSFTLFLKSLFAISFLWIVVFAFAGLYNIRGVKNLAKEVGKVIAACSTGFMLIVVLIFVRRELFDSRFIILAGWLLAIVYISLARSIVRFVQRSLFKKGVGVHKVVLVGGSKTSESLIQEFSKSKTSGYDVVKRFWNFDLDAEKEFEDFMKIREVDEVIQCDPNLPKAEALRLFDFTDENHLVFKYAADLMDTKVLKTEVNEVAGIPIIEVKKTPLDGWGRIAKRIFDIVVSLILIILFSPILLLTALIVKLDSRGPILYLDYRSGQYNKKFLFYKFRSMEAHLCDGEGPSATNEGNKVLQQLVDSSENTRSEDPLHKIKDDPRVTKVGMFIRRWSIDELPQLFNVLFGDISLVGPRPHMTLETARYERHHKKVLSIKPGITGLAQISGRSDLSFEEEIKLDTYYIENWTMFFDFVILLRTPVAVFRKRKVE